MPWSWSGPSTSTSRASARSSARPPTSSRRSAASDTDSTSPVWSSLDRHRGRGSPLLGVLAREILSPVDQLRADHGDLARGVDPQPDLASLQPDHGHADVVADVKLLHQLA